VKELDNLRQGKSHHAPGRDRPSRKKRAPAAEVPGKKTLHEQKKEEDSRGFPGKGEGNDHSFFFFFHLRRGEKDVNYNPPSPG